MASTRLRLAVGLAALIIVAGLAGLGFAVSWFVRNVSSSNELTAAEREAVVTAAAVAEWHGAIELDPAAKETIDVRRFTGFGGSLEVEYEYEAEGLYILNWVNRELTSREARQTYTMFELGLKVGFRIQDEAALERTDWSDRVSFGAESTVQLITNNGKPAGHVVRVLDGHWVFAFLVAGIYTADPDDLSDLIEPRLAAMRRLPVTTPSLGR